MARVSSSKHNRDQALDFQDFLTDLQDWEHSLKEKDKKLKSHLQEEKKVVSSSSGKVGFTNEDNRTTRRAPIAGVNKPTSEANAKVSRGSSHEQQQFDYLRSLDTISHLSGSLMTEEGTPDAASEKELGNEYYKQGKFHKAIECYSRSIALSPSSVAFANRAMAYIKVKKFEEAENDCTEALNLDDRYVKAYSRRATARKELGKFKLSMEDSEFALRLEPNNQELQKLYTEVKELCEKEIVKKASLAFENAVQRMESTRNSEIETKGHCQRAQITAVEAEHSEDNIGEVRRKPAAITEENDSVTTTSRNKSSDQQSDTSQRVATSNSSKESSEINKIVGGKHKVTASVQELASRAASQALAAAAKNITAPKSAYQFEVSWRALADDHLLQAHLLKTIPPSTLPQIFKNALSAPILVDIVRSIATFFMEETELSIEMLDNLTKVARFDMIIMCLSNNDKAATTLIVYFSRSYQSSQPDDVKTFYACLSRIWNEVFSNEAAMAGHVETIRRLRPRYCPGSGM